MVIEEWEGEGRGGGRIEQRSNPVNLNSLSHVMLKVVVVLTAPLGIRTFIHLWKLLIREQVSSRKYSKKIYRPITRL